MKQFKTNVDILGERYEVKFTSELNEPELDGYAGLCKSLSKEILINTDIHTLKDENDDISRLFANDTVRHELVHAFLNESGLTQYSYDETLVEFIAMQLPKINKVVEKLMADMDKKLY